MPCKQLNIWRKNYPDVMYANLYGPTEITDVCTYYVVDRDFNDDDVLLFIDVIHCVCVYIYRCIICCCCC